MSYDLHLFCAPAGADLLRAAKESLAAEENGAYLGPLDPEAEQRLKALAAALQAHKPEFDIVPLRTESPAPAGEAPGGSTIFVLLSTPGDPIYISLAGDTASVGVGYWYSGGSADQVWEEVWECLAVLRREGGFHVYDPQLGRVLDLGLDRPAVLEKYLEGESYAEAEFARGAEEQLPWWIRRFRKVARVLRSSLRLAPQEVEPRLRNRRETEARLTEVATRHAARHPEAGGRTETIVLRMVVTSGGGSEQVEVTSTECDPALVEEVIEVGAGMRFRPARLDYAPVPVLITIPVTIRFPG
jgi:hypothetical protein